MHAGWGILLIVLACLAAVVLVGFGVAAAVQRVRDYRGGKFARCVTPSMLEAEHVIMPLHRCVPGDRGAGWVQCPLQCHAAD